MFIHVCRHTCCRLHDQAASLTEVWTPFLLLIQLFIFPFADHTFKINYEVKSLQKLINLHSSVNINIYLSPENFVLIHLLVHLLYENQEKFSSRVKFDKHLQWSLSLTSICNIMQTTSGSSFYSCIYII